MTDLTAITTPFGLLDRETQEALKAHGGPYQIYQLAGQWDEVHPAWSAGAVYRVKPVPREWWAVGAHMHTSEDNAQEFLAELKEKHPEMNFGPITHVREVLE